MKRRTPCLLKLLSFLIVCVAILNVYLVSQSSSDDSKSNIERALLAKKQVSVASHNNNSTENNATDDDDIENVRPSDPYRVHTSLGSVYSLARLDHNRVLNATLHTTIPTLLNLDPLHNSTLGNLKTKLNTTATQIKYLGVLVDAGRHYYPLPWLRRLVDIMAMLKYNLMHLRLTDDQSFNILLKSYPQLAYPTAYNNPQQLVYRPDELRALVKYGKSKNVRIMPEINVPGHAAAWFGIPDLVVPCPRFSCESGYGLPLNTSHVDIWKIIKSILSEVVSIFDNPPYLHLGGDELHMSRPCYTEIGMHRNNDKTVQKFEKTLQRILKAIDYPESQVVRWEITQSGSSSKKDKLHRAGDIEHLWLPGMYKESKSSTFFASAGLYCDINSNDDAWVVMKNTLDDIHSLVPKGPKPAAIIVGGFELDPEMWYDRNVIGRMLAVAIGAQDGFNMTNMTADTVNEMFATKCNELNLGAAICNSNGTILTKNKVYKKKWENAWTQWKDDLCYRVATWKDGRSMATADASVFSSMYYSQEYFVQNFARREVTDTITLPKKRSGTTDLELRRLKHKAVKYTGMVFDAPRSPVLPSRLSYIVNSTVAALGMNWVQLRLMSHFGAMYSHAESESITKYKDTNETFAASYSNGDIKSLAKQCKKAGILLVPEASFIFNATGLLYSSMTAKCAKALCNDQSMLLSGYFKELIIVLFKIINDLVVHTRSPYFHLGSNERELSRDCHDEDLRFSDATESPDDYHTAMDKLELRIKALFEAAGIGNDQILRYNNVENVVYPKQTGGHITHYTAETDIDQVTTIKSDRLHFFSVDILLGSGWDLYQHVRRIVALHPLGIVAEVCTLSEQQWQTHNIQGRMLVFAMATSVLKEFTNEAAFSASFNSLCTKLGYNVCQVPLAIVEHDFCMSYNTSSTEHCNEYTKRSRDYTIKPVIEPFFKSKSDLLTSNAMDIFADL